MYDNYELMAAVELASKLYHHELMNGNGFDRQRARDYIGSRRLFAPAAEQFRVGYCPEGQGKPWILSKTGNARLLIEAGVLIEDKYGSLRDPMEKRIVFPQVNPSGKYLGFTGRTLPGVTHRERYMTTPLTPIFRRHEVLYRIDFARLAIESERSVIIVEGMLDAALMFQVGIHNVVAVGGKALTGPQAQILARYATNLQIMFDNNEAGREGASEARRRQGIHFQQVSVLDYPAKFDDPAEWVADRIERNMQIASAPTS